MTTSKRKRLLLGIVFWVALGVFNLAVLSKAHWTFWPVLYALIGQWFLALLLQPLFKVPSPRLTNKTQFIDVLNRVFYGTCFCMVLLNIVCSTLLMRKSL